MNPDAMDGGAFDPADVGDDDYMIATDDLGEDEDDYPGWFNPLMKI